MVMTSDPGEIQIPATGRIGYVREWESHPGTWDGWVEWSGSPTDELVCNGGSRDWATYVVIRRYQEHLMDGVAGAMYSMRTAEERRVFSDRVASILECSNEMREALKRHFLHIRREAARIEREAKG